MFRHDSKVVWPYRYQKRPNCQWLSVGYEPPNYNFCNTNLYIKKERFLQNIYKKNFSAKTTYVTCITYDVSSWKNMLIIYVPYDVKMLHMILYNMLPMILHMLHMKCTNKIKKKSVRTLAI